MSTTPNIQNADWLRGQIAALQQSAKAIRSILELNGFTKAAKELADITYNLNRAGNSIAEAQAIASANNKIRSATKGGGE
jgi:hypothetical protein